MDTRLLKASEIECRVQSVKKTRSGVGCILLLYKDARVDMKLLDEIYGPMNWQRTHEVINGNLFCGIEIWDESKKSWVKKQDVGVESNTEKEKGQASDSFKRAGFNWGIGRELYTAPFVWIDLKEGEFEESNGKTTLSSRVRFGVKSIGYSDEREINSLQIVDNHSIVRFDMKSTQETKPEPEGKPSKDQLKAIGKLAERKGVDLKLRATGWTGKSSSDAWSMADYIKVKTELEKLEDKK